MARPIETLTGPRAAAADAGSAGAERRRIAAWLRGAATADAVLADIDFEARFNELALIVDPDQAALRLFAILAGRETAAAGKGETLGQAPAGLALSAMAALRRRVFVQVRPPRLIEEWTAADNVALPRRLAGEAASAYDRDVTEALAFLGLAASDLRPVRALPESARRLIGFARAAAAGPDVMMCDDPFASQPPAAQRRIGHLLAQMAKAGAAVIIAARTEAGLGGLTGRTWALEAGALALTSGRGG